MSGRRERWLWNAGIPAVLLLVALIPRVVAFGPLTNPDELGWLSRSVQFYEALARGDWAGTLQAFHPGVFPMWGFGALMSARYGLSQLTAWRAAGTLPMADLARVALFFPILVSVLTVLAVYGLVRRLAGREAGFYAALLVALEPFYLVFTHFVHLDLIHGSLMLVAALLWLNYLHPPRRWPYLAGSGVVSGLALLTRSASVYLVPFGLLALGAYFLADNWTGRGIRLRPGWGAWVRRSLLAWLGWLGLILIVVVALWPALWVEPGTVIGRLAEGIFRSVENAHPAPAFFLGETIDEDPGTFYYWLVLLFRLRPLTLLLALLNPVLLLLLWRRLRPRQRAAWGLGLGYVVFYFTQMSLATHKLERYMVPVVLGLAVLAGLSLAVVGRWFAELLARRRKRSPSKSGRMAVLSAVVLLLAIPWLRLAPSFGAYFNPLVGGGQQALNLFTVGGGLGLDQVADYLNQKDRAQDLVVPSFYHYVFQYYFRGHTQRPNEDSWAGLPYTADYEVITSGEAQRDIYPPTLAFFLPRQPEFTVRINGINYAWLYAVPRRQLDGPPPIQHPLDANFENRVRLLGYDVGYTADGLLVTLYWQPLTTMHADLWAVLRLVGPAGQVVAERVEPPWSGNTAVLAWPGGLAVQDEHRLALPAGLAPGDYRLVLSLEQRNRDGYAWRLNLLDGGDTDLELGSTGVRPPLPSRPVAEGDLGGVVRLLGYDLPSSAGEDAVEAGTSLPLTLTWECLDTMQQDYTVFVHLAGADGQPLAQADGPPLGGSYPTSFWDEGERLDDPYVLDIPADVPPGEYELRVGMYLLATGERLPLTAAGGQILGDSIPLTEVEIAAP